MEAINGLALCAGIGGLELGLKLVLPSCRTVCYVEREAFPAAILVTRMEEGLLDKAPIHSDLRSFDGRPWRGVVDIVTGGYPCQPFSLAGKRKAQDDPRHLWPHVLRVLRESGASLGFFENVRGHVSKGLREVLADLAGAGFDAEWDVFSAEEEGAPHRRERIFVLAFNRHAANMLGASVQRGESDGACQRASEAVAESSGDRQPGPGESHDGSKSLPDTERLQLRKQPRGFSGASREGAPQPEFASWWISEPDVGRVAHGVPSRVDRLRACGNGVVPAVAAHAFTELAKRATSGRARRLCRGIVTQTPLPSGPRTR